MTTGSSISYLLITGSPEVAREAQACGVDRIFVDLELRGKRERQAGRNSVISGHTFEDVVAVRHVAREGSLLVRLNPLSAESPGETDRAVEAGADFLMLPMFASAGELEEFCRLVAGRCPVVGLVETEGALREIDRVARVPGLSELYIGLNDLSLSLKLGFMFEPLARGMLDEACSAIRKTGIPYGFGGIARLGEGTLPAELILGEHLRLGSTRVILSRSFHRGARTLDELRKNVDLKADLEKLRAAEKELGGRTPEQVEEGRRAVQDRVKAIVAGER